MKRRDAITINFMKNKNVVCKENPMEHLNKSFYILYLISNKFLNKEVRLVPLLLIYSHLILLDFYWISNKVLTDILYKSNIIFLFNY